MRSVSAGLTAAAPLSARDTVATDTPATRATSLMLELICKRQQNFAEIRLPNIVASYKKYATLELNQGFHPGKSLEATDVIVIIYSTKRGDENVCHHTAGPAH
ncbi:exported hypothetical protein [Thiomonas sp. CB2]|nr:exported hypothetical protein [Thiomonas sp. CB2]